MTPKEHAIELLAQGIPTSQVAAACGITDAYVSQLKADPEIQQIIAERQAASSIADCTFDQTLERAETLALEKIEKNLPFANLGQAMAAFRILNTARRRKDAFAQPDHITSVTVNLTLPASSIPNYVTNNKSEIIEVEGKTMLSATAKTLDQILLERNAGSIKLPEMTAIEKAAKMLDSIQTPARQAPRRLPMALSADVL